MILVIQAALLIVLALPFGLNLHFGGALVVLALIALLGLLMTSLSHACALWLKSEDSFAPLIFTATVPLLLLSGVLLPLTLGTRLAARHRGRQPALLRRRRRTCGFQRPPGRCQRREGGRDRSRPGADRRRHHDPRIRPGADLNPREPGRALTYEDPS